jgi:hypothetical protein
MPTRFKDDFVPVTVEPNSEPGSTVVNMANVNYITRIPNGSTIFFNDSRSITVTESVDVILAGGQAQADKSQRYAQASQNAAAKKGW